MTGSEPRSSKKMKGLKRKKKKEEEKKLKEDDEDCKTNDKEVDSYKDLHPIGHYISNREEMITEVFRVISGEKLKAMLPPVLKDIPIQELKSLCLDQLEGMSKKRIRYVLAGREMDSSSDTEEDSEVERGNRAQKEKPHRQPADSTSGDTREGEEPQQSETTRETSGSPCRAPSDHDADTLQIRLDMDEMQDFVQDDCNQRKKNAKWKKNLKDSEIEKNKCRSSSDDPVSSSSKKGNAGELKRKSVAVPLENFNETKDKKKAKVSEKDEKKGISKGHEDSVSFQKSRKKDGRAGFKRRSEEEVHTENSKRVNTHVERRENVCMTDKKHFQGNKKLDKFSRTAVKKNYDDEVKQKPVTEETEELSHITKLEKEVGIGKEKDKSTRDRESKGEKEKKKKGEEEEEGEAAKGKTLMELLELEMRARAIKSLLQRGEFGAEKESNGETEELKNDGRLPNEMDKESEGERKNSEMKAVKDDDYIISLVEDMDDSESREEGELKDDEDQVAIMKEKEKVSVTGKREREKKTEETDEKKNKKMKECAVDTSSPHRDTQKEGSDTDMEKSKKNAEKQRTGRSSKTPDSQCEGGSNKNGMKESVYGGSKADEAGNTNECANSDDSKERENQKVSQGHNTKEVMKMNFNKEEKIMKIRHVPDEERKLKDSGNKKMYEKDGFGNGSEAVKKKSRQYRQRTDSSSGSEDSECIKDTDRNSNFETYKVERYSYSDILQCKKEKNKCLTEENKNNRKEMKNENVDVESLTSEQNKKIFNSGEPATSVKQVEKGRKRKVKGSDMNREDGECDSSTDDMNYSDSGTEESDEMSSNGENKIKVKATENIIRDSDVKNNKNLVVENSTKGEIEERIEGRVKEVCIEVSDSDTDCKMNETKDYNSSDTEAEKAKVHCVDREVNNDLPIDSERIFVNSVDKSEIISDATKEIIDAEDGSHKESVDLSTYVKSVEEPDIRNHIEITVADSSVDLERAAGSDNELMQEAYDSRNVQREREECKIIQIDEVQVPCSTTDICDNTEVAEAAVCQDDAGKVSVQGIEIVDGNSEAEPESHQKDRQINDFYGNLAKSLTEEIDITKERLARELLSGTVISELDTSAPQNEAECIIKDDYVPESATINIRDHTNNVKQEDIEDKKSLEEKQGYLQVQEKNDSNENSLQTRKDTNAKKIQKSTQRAIKEKLENSDIEKSQSDCTVKFVSTVSKIDAVPNITQETTQDQSDKINQGELEQSVEDDEQLSVERQVSTGSSLAEDRHMVIKMEQTKETKKYSKRQSTSEKDTDKNLEVLSEFEPEHQGFHVTRKTILKPELDQMKEKYPKLYIHDTGDSEKREMSRKDVHMEESSPNSEERMTLVYKEEDSGNDYLACSIKEQKLISREAVVKEEKDRGRKWQIPFAEVEVSDDYNEKSTRKSGRREAQHAEEHDERQLDGTECEMKDLMVEKTISHETDMAKQIGNRSRRKPKSHRKGRKASRNSKVTTLSPKKISKKEKLHVKQIKRHKKVGSWKKGSKSEVKPEDTQEQAAGPDCQKEGPRKDRKCRSEKDIGINKEILDEVRDYSRDIMKNLSLHSPTILEGQSTSFHEENTAENELNQNVEHCTSKQKNVQNEPVTYSVDKKETYRADTLKDERVKLNIKRDDVNSTVISESSEVSDRIIEEIANKENVHLEIIREIENREHVDNSHTEDRIEKIAMKDAINSAGWDTDDEELFAAAFDRESKAEEARLEAETEKIQDEIPKPYPYKLSYMEKVALLQKKTRMIDNLFPEEKPLDESEEKLATETIAETVEETEMANKSELNSDNSDLNSDLSEQEQRKKKKKDKKEKKKCKEQEMEGIGYWKELCTNRGDFVEPELEEEHKESTEITDSSVVMEPVEKQDVIGQEEKEEDNPVIASTFTGAKNITWSERWFHSQRVQKVVTTSRMFGKIRHKMKSMKRKDDDINSTKEEESKSSEELRAIIGSIEEYEQLFGKKVVIQEKTEAETKESEPVEKVAETKEEVDTDDNMLDKEVKSTENESTSVCEDGNLTDIIQTGQWQPTQKGQEGEESDLDYGIDDEDRGEGDSEEDKLWGQIMGKD